MNIENILEWFGDCGEDIRNYNVVKCYNADEARTVINILEGCGLKQGNWRVEDNWLGIKVYCGEIHGYRKGSSGWELGTPFDEFMEMIESPIIIDDLI